MVDQIALRVEIATADDAPILRNLGELYAYDFSETVPLELHASGRFEVPPRSVVPVRAQFA